MRPKSQSTPLLATAVAVLVSVAGSAMAITPNLDFHVQDQASYDTFCAAIRASEHVRYDYVNNQVPRVAGAAAGLVAFATRNPLADEAQLTAFVNVYDAVLAGFAPGDPGLNRSSNFLSGVRFEVPAAEGVLTGTDPAIGEDVLTLLGVGVPAPDNYDSMRSRMVRFDRARIKSIANAPEWAEILVVGFSGQDLNGMPNANLAPVLQTYLGAQGYEAIPDGSPDDSRFADVEGALAASLPVDYADYTQMLAQPVETSDIWTSISGAFADVKTSTDARAQEFLDAMANEPTLIEGLANANNSSFMDQLIADYRSRIDEVAAPRTIVAANALFLLQSADPNVRDLAERSLDFSESQLQTNDAMAGVTSGVEILGGVAQVAAGFYKGEPGDVIEGITGAVLGSIGIADALGAGGPSVDEQIFDQITEMRDQLEGVRVEMNMRFNRIEDQLDVIYASMSDGFNAVGQQIGDLTDSVDDLSRQMMIARDSLERIEDALWGMSSDILDSYIAVLANDMLDYRDDNGVDLPYDGSTSFVNGLSGFYTVATFHALTTTFAGDQTSTLTVATANDLLNGESIGRNINDLRVFPAQLGLPVLGSSRVVAPAPWSQAANAYTQVAKESPWYFAYKYERELAGGGTPPELDQIIALGESFETMAAHGRNTALFNALFDGYNEAAGQIGARIYQVRQDTLHEANLEVHVDPWGGLTQEVQDYAPTFTLLHGQSGLQDYPLPTGIGHNCWNIYGETNVPELAQLVVDADTHSAGGGQPARNNQMGVTSGIVDVPNDMTVDFTFTVDGDYNGQHPELIRQYVRHIRWLVYSAGDPVQINSDSNARDIFDEDFYFWQQVVGFLLSGTSQQGDSIYAQNGNGENIRLDVVTDASGPVAAGRDASAYVTQRLDELQDDVWAAAASDSIVAGLSPLLPAYESLIEAYATLALPDMLEQSSAARACLRADPATGQLSMTFAGSVGDMLASLLGDGDSGEYFDLAGELAMRAAVAHDEVDAAIARPDAGQSYVDWTLAELRNLRDNTFHLAIDDTYQTAGTGTLSVAPADGVIANDVDQQFRVIQVDTGFVNDPAYTAPQHGEVQLSADGSFDYTPDPGFVGTDSFNYRTFTSNAGWVGPVYSDPALVVIRVDEGARCPVDFDHNGLLDLADVLIFVNAFMTNDPLADLAEPYGLFDLSDVLVFVTQFNAGCP